MPSVICIAGLDPSGHVGLSADFRALSFLGVRCLPIASTLTVQNENSFSKSYPVSSKIIEKQLDAIFEAEKPDAVKLGVLGNSDVAELVASYFCSGPAPVVTDPVFISSTGFEFANGRMIDIYKHKITPISCIITPNAQEASVMSGLKIEGPGDALAACRNIFEFGPGSVLVKGGHFKESMGTDVFYDSSGPHTIEGGGLRINIRGTGCAYSSLIAGYLSAGMNTLRAVRNAKADMSLALSISERTGCSVLKFEHRQKRNIDGER